MSNQKRILISLPESLLSEISECAENDNITRTEFVREAMRFYVRERKRQAIREQMEKGYAEMGAINLEIANSCVTADNIQFKDYEEMLSECEE